MWPLLWGALHLSRLLSQAHRAVLGHLEREAEARQILAGMIVRKGELRQAVIVRPCLLALIDRGIEIDEMPARLAGRLHDDFDITLTIEGAGIAADRVVVDHGVNVGGLAPADTLEVNLERCAGRPACDIERQRSRSNPEGASFFAAAGVDPKVVHAAEIVRRLEAELSAAGGVGFCLGDRACYLFPASAGHSITNDRIPIELVSLAGLKAGAGDHDWVIDSRECRIRNQLALRRQRTDRRLRLLRRRRR